MGKVDLTKSEDRIVARPRDVFSALREEMDYLFDRFAESLPRYARLPRLAGRELRVMAPDLDVRDTESSLVIEAELPGVDEKDVTVTLANGVLTIRGEKKLEREQKEANYYLSERSYGSFERALRMPETIDAGKIEARFEKGVLKITAPKRPDAVKAEKRIEIKAG